MRRGRVLSVLAGIATAAAAAAFALAPSLAAQAADDTQPPTVPGTPTATSPTANTAFLLWAASTDNVGVTGYDILRATGVSGGAFAPIGTSSGASFTDTTLTPNQTYRFEVRARDAAGNVSVPSGVVTVTTSTACTQPPPPPGNLAPSNLTPSSVTLTWGIVIADGGGFCSPVGVLVYRAVGTAGTGFTQIASLPVVFTYTDSTLVSGTTYRYQVRARDAAGNLSAPSNTITVTAVCVLPPIAVGNLTAPTVTATSVGLAWQGPFSACVRYEIQRAPGASGGTFATVGTATGTTFTDQNLTPGTTYRYQVRGLTNSGGTIGTTNTVTVTTQSGSTGGCTAAYHIAGAWGGAFQGEITVTNPGTAAITGWTVTAVFPSGVTITQMWGGTYSPASGTVAIRPTYNATVGAGQSTTAGFLANAPGSAGATATVSCTTP